MWCVLASWLCRPEAAHCRPTRKLKRGFVHFPSQPISWPDNKYEILIIELNAHRWGLQSKLTLSKNMRHATSRAVRMAIALVCFLPIWHANASVLLDVQVASPVSVGETVNIGSHGHHDGRRIDQGLSMVHVPQQSSPFTQVGNAAALVLSNVRTNDAGYYFVTVTYQSVSGLQTVSSTNVMLVVNLKPRIATQPVSLIKPVTSNAVFSVTVGGAPPLTFQWRQNGTNLTDDGRITGSNGTNLAIQNLTLGDTGNYDIVVGNFYGGATSQVALQVIVAPPVITSPTNASGKQGYAFNYSMTATGVAPHHFWRDRIVNGLGINPTNGANFRHPDWWRGFLLSVGLFATGLPCRRPPGIWFSPWRMISPSSPAGPTQSANKEWLSVTPSRRPMTPPRSAPTPCPTACSWTRPAASSPACQRSAARSRSRLARPTPTVPARKR